MAEPDASEGSEGSELRLQLPSHAEAVGEARRAVARYAGASVPGARRAELVLVVSEVVTNAIRHGGTGATIELRARRTAGRLRVEVMDAGAGLAPQPRATEPHEDGGFGLFLVEQLTHRWGLVRHVGTTRVWFEFELAPRAA